ncbi:MAG: hypothetical protein Q9193_006931, partial [Seirophora villosa]
PKPDAGEAPRKLEVKASPAEKPPPSKSPAPTAAKKPLPAKKPSPRKLGAKGPTAPKLGVGKSKSDQGAKAGGRKPGAAGVEGKENRPPKKLEVKPKTAAGATHPPEKGKIVEKA